jgi:hypothetical protein
MLIIVLELVFGDGECLDVGQGNYLKRIAHEQLVEENSKPVFSAVSA